MKLLCTLSLVTLLGCSSVVAETIDCDSAQAKQMFDDAVAESPTPGLTEPGVDYQIDFAFVTTVSKSEDGKFQECQALSEYVNDNLSFTMLVKYTIQMSDDGKQVMFSLTDLGPAQNVRYGSNIDNSI